MIYYSNPYSTSKNFGKAINDFCKLVPNDDDWIVIQDGDIIYLTSDWGRRIEDALLNYGNEFGLIGCYTNRLRGKHQLHNKEFSNDHDLAKHYQIALSYTDSGIEDIGVNGIAGFFMAFKKSTWIKAKGFKENTHVFDSLFNASVRNLGMKLGLIRSLYVYHGYRIWAGADAVNEIKHLR